VFGDFVGGDRPSFLKRSPGLLLVWQQIALFPEPDLMHLGCEEKHPSGEHQNPRNHFKSIDRPPSFQAVKQHPQRLHAPKRVLALALLDVPAAAHRSPVGIFEQVNVGLAIRRNC
jgi:hypothetical protein